MPSGHAAATTAFAAAWWPHLRRWGRAVAAAFVVWVGLSRVSVGDHFPADVVAGTLVGLGVVFLVRRWVHRALPLRT